MWDLNKDPGEGNLNLRAYIASLVGPRRVAYGQRRVYQVPAAQSVQIIKGVTGRQVEAVYVEAWLPDSVPGPVNFRFASQQDAIGETGVLVQLSNLPAVPQVKYAAVVLPGENLYVQLAVSAGFPAADPTPLVVSRVVF